MNPDNRLGAPLPSLSTLGGSDVMELFTILSTANGVDGAEGVLQLSDTPGTVALGGPDAELHLPAATGGLGGGEGLCVGEGGGLLEGVGMLYQTPLLTTVPVPLILLPDNNPPALQQVAPSPAMKPKKRTKKPPKPRDLNTFSEKYRRLMEKMEQDGLLPPMFGEGKATRSGSTTTTTSRPHTTDYSRRTSTASAKAYCSSSPRGGGPGTDRKSIIGQTALARGHSDNSISPNETQQAMMIEDAPHCAAATHVAHQHQALPGMMCGGDVVQCAAAAAGLTSAPSPDSWVLLPPLPQQQQQAMPEWGMEVGLGEPPGFLEAEMQLAFPDVLLEPESERQEGLLLTTYPALLLEEGGREGAAGVEPTGSMTLLDWALLTNMLPEHTPLYQPSTPTTPHDNQHGNPLLHHNAWAVPHNGEAVCHGTFGSAMAEDMVIDGQREPMGKQNPQGPSGECVTCGNSDGCDLACYYLKQVTEGGGVA
ncbi:uncharacterized protein LOC134435725 [Engraulis encrasicolus]|uniref:uncharacterized protein LOC134435725 n=1 Tax=Engraulis encrasicolus TaxID=184585 RepID=UPI002FCF3414